MRLFIRNTLVFIVAVSVTIIGIVYWTETQIKRKADFRISGNPEYLIIGHSHPENLFNDSIIPNLKNYGHSGESYFYTYFKVKELLNQNKGIKFILLEFTNNNIEKYMDNLIWDNSHINFRYPIYSPFMQLQDKWLLARNNPSAFINANSVSLRDGLTNRIRTGNYSFKKEIGGYAPITFNKVDSLVRVEKRKGKVHKKVEISEQNILYLKKIVSLVKQKGINLIFIRCPQHPYHPVRYNEIEFQRIRKSLFGDIDFWDFNDFPLKDYEFSDLEHAHYRGSLRFSIWFKELLSQKTMNGSKVQDAVLKETIRARQEKNK